MSWQVPLGPAMPLRGRILANVVTDVDTGCWLWQGHLDDDGYAMLSVRSYPRRAQRVAYLAFRGPIADDLVVDHLCRVRSCVNPDHLEPVTNAENIRRGARATASHCQHGHAFDVANTRVGNDGRRRCRACGARHSRDTYWRKRARAEEATRP
jgi:hypothetical protein